MFELIELTDVCYVSFIWLRLPVRLGSIFDLISVRFNHMNLLWSTYTFVVTVPYTQNSDIFHSNYVGKGLNFFR